MGPNQPSTADTSHDVEFRTVHDAKGDQDDVVAILRIPDSTSGSTGLKHNGSSLGGIIAGLAPPTNTDPPQTLRSHRSSTGCMIPKTRGTAMLTAVGYGPLVRRYR